MTDGASSTGSSRAKTVVFASLAVLIGLFGTVLALELVLRLLPVTEPLERQPVDATRPYLHYKPNNDVVHSRGWNFTTVNRAHVNNFGFVNDQDYDPDAKTPLLAVVGDSFVEATEVPYRETLHGRLASAVGSRGRVYSFGISGSQLSQYLAYAQYARDRFSPAALVVVIIGNDFDESLLDYQSHPGMHHFMRNADGSYQLHLVPFHPFVAYRLLSKSALAQYVNANMPSVIKQIRSVLSLNTRTFVGNVAAHADASFIESSKAAIDYFLDALPHHAGLEPRSIVLLVDGMRTELYDAQTLQKVQTSYFAQMREYLIARSRARGYIVADLQPRFIARHVRDGARFEWDIDHHWNSAGHEEAARAIVETGLPQRMFGTLSLQ